jgi:sec-independent protein translocase protein TatA
MIKKHQAVDPPLRRRHPIRIISGNIVPSRRYGQMKNNCNQSTHLFMTSTIAGIFNLMGPDMMVILLIVLLLFGAKKLPELARGMGKAVKEFSNARDEIERELTQAKSPRVAESTLPSVSGDSSSVP